MIKSHRTFRQVLEGSKNMEILKHGEKCSNEKRRKPRVKLKTMVTRSVRIGTGWRFSRSLPSSRCKSIWLDAAVKKWEAAEDARIGGEPATLDTGSEAVFGDSGEICVTAVEEGKAPFANVSVTSGGVSLLGLGATAAVVAAVVGQGRPSVDVSVASGLLSELGLGATAADVVAVVGKGDHMLM